MIEKKYQMELTEDEVKDVIFQRFMSKQPWFRKAMPFILFFFMMIGGLAVLVVTGDNLWYGLVGLIGFGSPLFIYMRMHGKESKQYIEEEIKKLNHG